MSLLTEKGWNKLSNPDEVKEVEVKALFNMIDKDQSGELSLEVSDKNSQMHQNILVIILNGNYFIEFKSFQEARKACKLIQARFNISEVSRKQLLGQNTL